MRCVHNEDGCLWEGERSQLNTHLENCKFDLKDCPAGYKRCEHCGVIFTVESEATHVSTCIQLPIPCPNNCLLGCVPRGQLKQHLNQDCEMNIQVCPFNDVGCKYEDAKNRSSKHMKNSLDSHLLKLNTYVQQTNSQQIEENIKIKAENERLRTCFNHLTINVQKQSEENKRLKDVNEIINANLAQLTQIVNKQNKEYKNLNIRLNKLTQTLKKQYEENRKMKDEIEILKNEAELIWIIEDFKKNMRKAKNGNVEFFYSPIFYSHKNGYKMRLRLYLNGDQNAKSPHLSLYWHLMKGEFDDLLEWPFPHELEFTLFDQNSNPSHIVKFLDDMPSDVIQKPKEVENDGYGFSAFISHKDLYGRNYVRNDKIVIKAKVLIN